MPLEKYSRLILFLLLLTVGFPLYAQKIELSGVVKEEGTSLPVEQATVKLLQPKDSALITGSVSLTDGTFVLKNVKKGSYLINVSFVGYTSTYKAVSIDGKTAAVDLGTFMLQPESYELTETVITAKAPEMVMRNDTMEYNADSYKVEEGAALEELFKKMPGVEVDNNGKITVNGKEITKIMVDGKEFFLNDPQMASKNLPSKMVDKIQILDKKSDMAKLTGFNDGEEETVINLTIKPEMKKGWLGKVSGGYGSTDRYQGDVMLNRFIGNDQVTLIGRSNNTGNIGGNGLNTSGRGGVNFAKSKEDKLQMNGSASYNYHRGDFQRRSSREDVLPGDSLSYYNSQNGNFSKSNNFSGNFRLEWTPDTMTTLIFTPNLNYRWNNNSSERTFNTLNQERDTVNMGESSRNTDSKNFSMNANLTFSKRLNPYGRVFSFSLSGGFNHSNTDGRNYSFTDYMETNGFQEDELIDQLIDNKGKNFNYRVHLSWVEPLGRNNFLQLTYTFNHNNSESLRYSYSQDENGNFTRLDSAYSQSYRNNFINQQIRLSFKAQREKYFYIIGVHLDPSLSKSRTFVGDSTLSRISRNVVNFSPNMQFMYFFDKRTNIRVDYNGNTSQPSVAQLQPVADVSNPLNIVQGNPDLKPTFNNYISMRFRRSEPETQRNYIADINANYTINAITGYSIYDAQLGRRYSTYRNINGNYGINGSLRVDYPIFNKKLILRTTTRSSFNNRNTYINGEKNTNKNMVVSERAGARLRLDNVDLSAYGSFSYNQARNSFQTNNDKQIWNYGVDGYMTLILPYKFRIESDIRWRVNTGYSDGYENEQIIWNASVSRSFFKGNAGTLRFKIYDILKQRTNISRNIGASFTEDSEFNSLTSFFIVSFVYQFNVFTSGG